LRLQGKSGLYTDQSSDWLMQTLQIQRSFAAGSHWPLLWNTHSNFISGRPYWV